MKKLAKENDTVKTYGTDKILFKSDGSTSMAWNNNVFVINLNAEQQLNSVRHEYIISRKVNNIITVCHFKAQVECLTIAKIF